MKKKISLKRFGLEMNILISSVNSIITARMQRMGEGNIFTLCVSPHLDWGGGTPSQVWTGGGYLIPGLDREVPHHRSGLGFPIPGLGKRGTPCQVWTGSTPGYPPARSGWWGVPRVSPSQVWMVGGYPGVPPRPPILDGLPPLCQD